MSHVRWYSPGRKKNKGRRSLTATFQGECPMVTYARVYLDENSHEYGDEAVRCGIIVTRDTTGKEQFHQEIIDNAGYACVQDLVRDIAGIFNISRQQVLVN